MLWLQVGVIGLVAFMLMLVMGGVYPGTRALAGCAIALLFLVSWSTRLWVGEAADSWDRSWLWVWLVLSGWIALQLLPLPRGVFYWLGVYPARLLNAHPELPVTRLSPDPAVTLGYWAMFTTYWARLIWWRRCRGGSWRCWWACWWRWCSPRRLYGFAAHVGHYHTVLGLWPARDDNQVVVGTYWNRNHMAGLMALGWPLGIGFLLYGTRSGQHRINEWRYLLVVVFAFVVTLALFNTLSRLGTMAGLFGLAVFVLLSRYHARQRKRSVLERFWMISAGVIALGLAIMFGLAPLLTRYVQTIDGQEIGRLQVWSAIWSLPVKTWLIGAGAGCFADVFKLVEPASLKNAYFYMHNDWLQFLLEFGVVGSATVAAALFYWWRRVGPSQFVRLRAAAAGGVAAIALHSLGDFNLQIPGTAFAFWIVVGVLCNRDLKRQRGRLTGSRRAA